MRENNSDRGSKKSRDGASEKNFSGARVGKSKPGGFKKFSSKDDKTRRFSKDDRFAKPGSFKKRTSEDGESRGFKSRDDRGGKPGGFKKEFPTDRGLPYKKREDAPRKFAKKEEVRKPKSNPAELRLNQFIAKAGVCSRREADKLIAEGVVSVNGKIVTEMGVKVTYADEVKIDNTLLKAERKVYLLLNKPKDTVTTLKDPNAKHTVFDIIKEACPERIYPVGRLDRNTTGVLLFTNDGDLSAKLTHPKYNQKKIYHVFLDKNITKTDMKHLADGVELEDGLIVADEVNYVDSDDKKQVGIEIHSGRNRIVRRMFEKLGYEVLKLDRVYFAGMTKKNVPRGKFRFLTDTEVTMLKMLK